MKKFAIIQFSGNVGKTLVCRHLIAARLPGAEVISVETINADGQEDASIRGDQFGEMTEVLGILENVVVDVGASNVEAFLRRMREYRGSHEDFDAYVVPVVPDLKQQKDAVATIMALREIGVPAKKIRAVFNKIELGADAGDEFEKTFSNFIKFHETEKSFVCNLNCVIHTSELFAKLGKKTIAEVLDDKTDFEKAIAEAKDSAEKIATSRARAVRRMAVGVNEELDAVFKALVK